MYCNICEKKIKNQDKFCPYCGAEVPKSEKSQEDEPVTWEILIEENISEQQKKEQMENRTTDNSCINPDSIFGRFWHNETFTKLAIRFDQFLCLVISVIAFICGIIMFMETGFLSKLLAIPFVLIGPISIIGNIEKMFHKIKKDYDTTYDWQKNPDKQKRNFLIGVPLTIFILYIIIQLCSPDIYDNVERIAFAEDQKNIGKILDSNVKNKEWSKEKIDKGCYRVAVTGYSPLYDDNIRISFYYEEKDDIYQVKLNRIMVGDETYNDALSASFAWAALCNYEEQLNQN